MSSSIAVMESQFTEQFKGTHTDDATVASREKAFRFFAANGFPTVRHEDWKYTNVAPIGKENWLIASTAANLSPMSDRFGDLFGKFRFDRNGFAALNQAFADIVTVTIPKETKVDEPIEISFAADEAAAIFPRILIVAEAGCKATIIETYTSPSKSFTDAAVQIVVEENASITHYRVQKDAQEAFNVGTTEISLGRDSRYNSTNINLGSALSRHDIDLKFTQEGGEAFVDGLYMLNGTQHHDTHSIIDHLVPNCTSHQSYKGILNDKSRGVFNGKVFVRENAHGTDAKQSNKNLLLSNDARIDTKPQLEIYNDDVKCAHGATVGQLEEEELFYLLTRGLPENLARNLLTYG
ncbi:MAG: Fe-S cluster assembly protein SufD, partial [Pyrinomonadaceae bacterium]